MFLGTTLNVPSAPTVTVRFVQFIATDSHMKHKDLSPLELVTMHLYQGRLVCISTPYSFINLENEINKVIGSKVIIFLFSFYLLCVHKQVVKHMQILRYRRAKLFTGAGD